MYGFIYLILLQLNLGQDKMKMVFEKGTELHKIKSKWGSLTFSGIWNAWLSLRVYRVYIQFNFIDRGGRFHESGIQFADGESVASPGAPWQKRHHVVMCGINTTTFIDYLILTGSNGHLNIIVSEICSFFFIDCCTPALVYPKVMASA